MPPTRKHPNGSMRTSPSLWQISQAYCDCGWSEAETIPRRNPLRRYLMFSRGFGLGDFLRAVTKRPENRVGLSQRRSTKVGIDVFPNNLTVSGDFEKASKG